MKSFLLKVLCFDCHTFGKDNTCLVCGIKRSDVENDNENEELKILITEDGL
jgi:hypothetical protein